MSKFLLILIIAFDIFVFVTIDMSSKAQVVQAASVIPTKVMELIKNASDSIEGAKK